MVLLAFNPSWSNSSIHLPLQLVYSDMITVRHLSKVDHLWVEADCADLSLPLLS